MRTFILSLLLILLYGLAAMDAIAFRNEPDGFRGMSWGASAEKQFTQDDFVGFNSDEKSSKYQVIPDAHDLEIENIKLHGMICSFYKGMFWKMSWVVSRQPLLKIPTPLKQSFQRK